MTPLGNGAVVPALAGAPGSELRFSIDVPPGATDLHIRTSGGSGDPDLYLRYGGLPTQLTHDCRSDTEGTADQCLLERPEAGTHHILVAGFAEYSGVSLSAGFTPGVPSVSVVLAGEGSGTVTSDPPGIDCGATCTIQYAAGTQATLTAVAAPGSTFSGWSGDCTGTQRGCILRVDGPRAARAIFSPGAAGAAVDEPAIVRLGLPLPDPADANCPSGYYVMSAEDGPGSGLNAGTFGMEVLLDSPGSRVLAGGLNFGGLMDAGQAGFAGFTIANAANEPQIVNLTLSGSPADDANGSVSVHIRVARVADATTIVEVLETAATISLAVPYHASLTLSPGFHVATIAPISGVPGGAAEGQFFASLATRFTDRPGGGFQGGAVVGGHHAAHPYGGVSGFLGLCVETPHTSTVRLLSQPSYGIAGARDLRLRVRDARQRELAVVPGS